MNGFVAVGVGLVVFGIGVVAYCTGWYLGVKDTERRWAAAVSRKADYDRIMRRDEWEQP